MDRFVVRRTRSMSDSPPGPVPENPMVHHLPHIALTPSPKTQARRQDKSRHIFFGPAPPGAPGPAVVHQVPVREDPLFGPMIFESPTTGRDIRARPIDIHADQVNINMSPHNIQSIILTPESKRSGSQRLNQSSMSTQDSMDLNWNPSQKVKDYKRKAARAGVAWETGATQCSSQKSDDGCVTDIADQPRSRASMSSSSSGIQSSNVANPGSAPSCASSSSAPSAPLLKRRKIEQPLLKRTRTKVKTD